MAPLPGSTAFSNLPEVGEAVRPIRGCVIAGGPAARTAHPPRPCRCRTACVPGDAEELPIGGGESIRLPKKRTGTWPNIDLTREQAVELQLEALQRNNEPFRDHGVEVLYRFANFDPFQRSNFFGRPLDLGQFERFRRILHSPEYSILLDHTDRELLSTLQVSENVWKQRVWVMNRHRKEEDGTFEFTIRQMVGGRYDAYFFTDSLKRDSRLT
eukprot:evm.model.scf_31.3 EVM.evm.TU.scf_31.3   scf_31:46305-51402(-)